MSSLYVPPLNFNQTLNEFHWVNNSTEYIDNSKFLSVDRNTALTQIASSQCFWVGMIHFLMGLFQLGFLCTLFTETLIKGFTAASAVLVCTSQLKSIFGLPLTRYYGPFNLIKV